jgi:hypothetical protein
MCSRRLPDLGRRPLKLTVRPPYQLAMPTASWNGQAVMISCAMVSRYAWTTASIDVSLGSQVILRTGGQAKFTGSHTEPFQFNGSGHTAQLTWGVSGPQVSCHAQHRRIEGRGLPRSHIEKVVGMVALLRSACRFSTLADSAVICRPNNRSRRRPGIRFACRATLALRASLGAPELHR